MSSEKEKEQKYIVVWQWENEGCYQVFSKLESEQIEKDYQKKFKKGNTTLKANELEFHICFTDMTQYNTTTRMKRRVKREEMNEDELYILSKIPKTFVNESYKIVANQTIKKESNYYLSLKEGETTFLTGIDFLNKIGKGHKEFKTKIGLFKLEFFNTSIQILHYCPSCKETETIEFKFDYDNILEQKRVNECDKCSSSDHYRW
jgi:hypothetical protein